MGIPHYLESSSMYISQTYILQNPSISQYATLSMDFFPVIEKKNENGLLGKPVWI